VDIILFCSAMSLAYIFAATQAEARALRGSRSIGGMRWRRSSKAKLFVTGIGPEAASASAERAVGLTLSGPRPAAFLVIGICGSLSPSLAEGTIVTYTACLTAHRSVKMSRIEASPLLVSRISAALAAENMPFEMVTGITSPAVAALRCERLRLAEQGASVVDMESYQILSAAQNAIIPGAVLRVVSDSLDRDLPDFTPAMRSNGSLDRLAGARIALSSPLSTVRLMFAQRGAIRRLRAALKVIFAADCLVDPTP
jgi:nucleoside phosphorylase